MMHNCKPSRAETKAPFVPLFSHLHLFLKECKVALLTAFKDLKESMNIFKMDVSNILGQLSQLYCFHLPTKFFFYHFERKGLMHCCLPLVAK